MSVRLSCLLDVSLAADSDEVAATHIVSRELLRGFLYFALFIYLFIFYLIQIPTKRDCTTGGLNVKSTRRRRGPLEAKACFLKVN